MSVTVRAFAKINLGLCIGSLRPDGFHELRTVYQTIALHDVVRLRIGGGTGIEIRCDDPRVPRDQSNTCYRIVERAMELLEVQGRVVIEIEKRLPVQGGLGGASGNAVAALLALELALKNRLPWPDKLSIAGKVGSDLPLFLIGGTVLGSGRGEEVYPLPDLPSLHCVVAMPEISISTPQAFADWDLGMCGAAAPAREGATARLGQPPGAKAAEGRSAPTGGNARPYAGKGNVKSGAKLMPSNPSDRIDEFSRRISAWLSSSSQTEFTARGQQSRGSKVKSGRVLSGVPAGRGRGRAETPLLDLVRTGIENDFEHVVFPKYPELGEVKSVLERAGAFYASLSGSGSTVYGLFHSKKQAETGASVLKKGGIRAAAASALTRSQYWNQLRID